MDLGQERGEQRVTAGMADRPRSKKVDMAARTICLNTALAALMPYAALAFGLEGRAPETGDFSISHRHGERVENP